MAWSWSHTAEGLAAAESNLRNQSKGWIATALAEHQFYDEDMGSTYTPAASVVLNGNTRVAMEQSFEYLATEVWNKAQDFSTCDNGGFNLWMCPYGCHTVTPDSP